MRARIFGNGITCVQKLSSFWGHADLVTVLTNDFELYATASLQQRAEVASIVCAWDETKAKRKRGAEMEAELNSREWTKPIPIGRLFSDASFFSEAHGTDRR